VIRKTKGEKPKKVTIGTKVLVRINNQENDEFIIVESLEANPFLGKISVESPVGKALLGKSKEDIITVHSATKTTYKILKIKYD